MLDDIVAHDIAQGIGIPIPATKDSLLPPWTRIASCLRPHPAGLALLITEQTFQKQACVPRNPFLPEQWTYPLLKLLKRRSPQRKRLFNRRCLRPRSSNHGCPWIQKSSERATVMLALKSLPVGTAYAVWTGIGAVGTAALGIYLFNEPATLLRLACIGLILSGIIGLKITS